MVKQLPDKLYDRLKDFFNEDIADKTGYVHRAEFEAVDTDDDKKLIKDAVEDGDTLYGRRKPDPVITFRAEYYRIAGLDTHETNADSKKKRHMAIEEKKAMRQFIKKGRQNYKGSSDYPFVCYFVGDSVEGTYGRPLVDIQRKYDGQSLTRWMTKFKFPNRDIEWKS